MSSAFTAYDSIRFRYRAWKYRLRTERAEIKTLLNCVSPGDICLDIGAHKGAFTYWMRKRVGPKGRVLTFEPQPELAGYLRRMAKTYSFRNVGIFETALSSSCGSAMLCRDSEGPSPGASLETMDLDKDHRFEVRVDRLDDILDRQQISRVDFIKCDAEGHEHDVFIGAESTLITRRPPILFECEQRHVGDRDIRDTFRLLERYGYDGWFFRRGALQPIDDFVQIGTSPDYPDYVYNFLFRPLGSASTKAA